MGPVLTMTLAQLAIFAERCATFQDPAFGDTPEQATERALEHVFGHAVDPTSAVLIVVA